MADAALHTGRVTFAELRALLRGMKGWKGVGWARQAVALADPLCESPGETRTRLLLAELGYRTRSQVVIRHRNDFVARADFAIEGTMVLVEFDGAGKYHLEGDPKQALQAEKRRHDALIMAGYELVRLTWRDLADRELVRDRLANAVRRSQRRHHR